MPPYHRVTLRDDDYIADLKQHLSDFVEELEKKTEKAKSLGAYVVFDNVTTPLENTYGDSLESDTLSIVLPE